MNGKVHTWPGTPHLVLEFYCPGCKDKHSIPVEIDRKDTDAWQWNGSHGRPTISPSIFVRNGHYCDTGDHDHPCWCDFNKERIDAGEDPSGFACFACHSFVRDGKIEFLSDCSHSLAGQTVELPEVNQ